MKLFIKDTAYLDGDWELLPGSLVIENGEIRSILAPGDGREAEAEAERADRVLDGKNMVCVPGLINAHLHPSKELYKGYRSTASLPDVLSFIHARNPHESPEDQYWAALYSLKEAVKKGTTGVGIFTSRYKSDLLALRQIGMRGAVYYAVNESWRGKEPAPSVMRRADLWRELENYLAKESDGNVRLNVATASEMTASREFLMELHRFAADRRVSLSLHAAEGESQSARCLAVHGKTSIEHLYDCGVLTENTVLIHSSWLNGREVSLLRSSRTSLVYCPIANSFTGAGLLPLSRLIDGRCRIGIGTDSGMINPPDAVAQDMLFGFYSQGIDELHKRVPLGRFLEMGTDVNAAILGFERVGRVAEGWKADLCLYPRAGFPLCAGDEPVLSVLTNGLANRPVHVVIDGRLVVENGRFSAIDEAEVDARFGAARRRCRPMDVAKEKAGLYPLGGIR